ncbi:MAG TPA: hypothetical protein DEA08_31575 [Planctomycetes bacterium]|nr:hypothetical protein [Planctomycetota bacterium]
MPRALLLLVVLVGLSGCASTRWEREPLEVRARCDACGRRTGPEEGGVRWVPDGRCSCATCAEEAIVTAEGAAELLAEARELLEDELDLEVTPAVEVSLATRSELASAAPELAHPNLRAFCQIRELLRGEEVVRRDYEILALGGLPATELRGILCHELVHVAQAEVHGASDAGQPAFREGAACWVQYRIHQERGEDRWVRQLIESRDPTYGGGLRRFLRLAQSKGEEEAIRLALERKRFPPGY